MIATRVRQATAVSIPPAPDAILPGFLSLNSGSNAPKETDIDEREIERRKMPSADSKIVFKSVFRRKFDSRTRVSPKIKEVIVERAVFSKRRRFTDRGEDLISQRV